MDSKDKKNSIYDVLIEDKEVNSKYLKKNNFKKYYLTSIEIKIITYLSFGIIFFLGYSIYYSYTSGYIKYSGIWFYFFLFCSLTLTIITLFVIYLYEYVEKYSFIENYTYKKSRCFVILSISHFIMSFLYLLNLLIDIFIIVKHYNDLGDANNRSQYGVICFIAFALYLLIDYIFIHRLLLKKKDKRTQFLK
jgi:hypothetical protein